MSTVVVWRLASAGVGEMEIGQVYCDFFFFFTV
jgi:hypothetical protein